MCSSSLRLTGALIVVLLANVVRGEFRTWSDASGEFQIEAEFVEMVGEQARLRTREGRFIRIHWEKLGTADRKVIRNYLAARGGDKPDAPSEGDAKPVTGGTAKPPTAEPVAEAATPAATTDVRRTLQVTPVPADRGIPDFYRQHIDLNGFSVVGSERVSGKALAAAYERVRLMTAERPEILRELAFRKVYLAVMAPDEVTTQLPEYNNLTPRQFWDQQTRGIGATPDRLMMSCAEENLLQLEQDKYRGEQVLVHEFAHTVHEIALPRIAPSFDQELQAAYAAAMKKGRWQKTHAALNYKEYWAEGVQCWFNCNREADPPDGVHNYVNTREELLAYDAELARLVDQVFP